MEAPRTPSPAARGAGLGPLLRPSPQAPRSQATTLPSTLHPGEEEAGSPRSPLPEPELVEGLIRSLTPGTHPSAATAAKSRSARSSGCALRPPGVRPGSGWGSRKRGSLASAAFQVWKPQDTCWGFGGSCCAPRAGRRVPCLRLSRPLVHGGRRLLQGGWGTRARARPFPAPLRQSGSGARGPPLEEFVRALVGRLGPPQGQRILQRCFSSFYSSHRSDRAGRRFSGPRCSPSLTKWACRSVPTPAPPRPASSSAQFNPAL